MFALKELFGKLGSVNTECRQDGAKLDPKHGRASYLFNSTIAGIDKADAIVLVGTNPRLEAPILNARIRKRWRQGGLEVYAIGEPADLGYAVKHLGTGPEALTVLLDSPPSGKERPMVIFGAGVLTRPDGAALLAAAAKRADARGALKDGWNGFNILHTAASRVAGLDLGFVAPVDVMKGDMEVVYLLGADEVDMAKLGQAFVIYQGHHGDAGAHRADVILPGSAYTEKSATYVNLEGRAQMTAKAAFAPGDAKEDWAIIRALSAECGQALAFDTIAALRAAMYQAAPQLARLNSVVAADPAGVRALANAGGSIAAGILGAGAFKTTIRDFYLTNPIARASAIMAELSQLAHQHNGAKRQAAE